jgi:hypothetical protein
MISFRFHIVSLTAVFLSLAIGIGIGAAVVDRKTVDFLEGRLDTVERRANATAAENDTLRGDVSRWKQFGDQGATAFVRGQLEAPVIVVGVQGIDRKPVDAFRQLLVASGARLQGTVWFTSKLELTNAEDVRALQAIVGATTARPDLLRRATATRLAEGWLPGGAPTVLPALRDGGFVEFEPPTGEPVDLTSVTPEGTLTVVVSGPAAEVPNAEVAQPFITGVVQRAANRVLVAEAGRDATADAPAVRAVFLRPILADEAIANRLSTVDNLEEVRGRVAAVLSLVGLVEGKAGHYGTGRGAQRLVPEVGPLQP